MMQAVGLAEAGGLREVAEHRIGLGTQARRETLIERFVVAWTVVHRRVTSLV